jgi:hypothetical protein
MDTSPLRGPLSPRRVRRRQVLLAGAVGGGLIAAGGAGAAALLLGRGGDSPPPAEPGQRQTPSPSPSPSPPATPTAAATPAAVDTIQSAPAVFDQMRLRIDDPVEGAGGMYFMDTGTGAMEGYRVAGSRAERLLPSTTGEGRFVFANTGGSGDVPGLLLDRDTGNSWAWPGDRLHLLGANQSVLLFAELAPSAPGGGQTGRYLVLSPEMRQLATVDYAAPGWSQWVVGEHAAAALPHQFAETVALVDLATGVSRDAFSPPGKLGEKSLWMITLSPDRPGFRATAAYYVIPETKHEPRGLPSYVTHRVGWDGTLLDSWGPTSDPFESVSPDGRWRVRTQLLREVGPFGEGGGETWPGAVLLDASGAPVFRLRSAALRYGDFFQPQDRWLADSSGFVAMLARTGDEAGPGDAFRYGVVSLSGRIEDFPPGPRMDDRWYARFGYGGPVPSPFDPDLFSFGRYNLYNRRLDRWFVPRITDTNGPAHLQPVDSPWCARLGEMVFATGHGGHGGAGLPALLAPRLERAPFPDAPLLRFRVAGTGSCLNLRDAPSASGSVLACVNDGQELELDLEGERLWEGADERISFTARDGGFWALVRAGDQRGWASTAYLEWAL